jgi:glutamate-1-semialdehyde 2,1-aminomutase
MNSDQLELIKERYVSLTPKSAKAYQRAKRVIPSGVLSRARLVDPYPFYVKKGMGPMIVDLDDNEYIDCAMGFGPLILGHAHPEINEAIYNASKRGSQFGISHEDEYTLAKLVVDTVSAVEKVTFCCTGNEAVLSAIRIARGYTGKPMIAKFEGGYHGSSDQTAANFGFVRDKSGPVERPNLIPVSIGMSEAAQSDLLILPYNHDAAFNLIRQNKDKLSMVMIEVVQGVGGDIIVQKNFLEKLREVTRDCNVLLMFDEIITGYRLGLSGGQGYFGVEPDISTFGKIIGGGLPLSAIGGKNEIMEMINYTGNPDVDSTKRIFFAGTLNGCLLPVCAGAATLSFLSKHQDVYERMKKLGNKLRSEVNQFCKKEGFSAQMIGLESLFHMHFTDKEKIESVRDFERTNKVAESAFYRYLLLEGVYVPNVHMGFISAVHKEEHIDKIISAHCKALMKIRQASLI